VSSEDKVKYPLLSLVENPPSGFAFKPSLSKHDVRCGPFALYSHSLQTAELQLKEHGGFISGIIVTDSMVSVWEPRGVPICHLGDPASLRPHLAALLPSFLELLEAMQSCSDENRHISIELARAVEDRHRLANDFALSRKSLLEEISERKKIEEQQQILSSLVENSNDLIGIASFDGNLVYLNRAGKKLLGLEDVGDVRTFNMREMTFPKFQSKLESIFLVLLKTGSWKGGAKYRHYKSGASIPIETHAFVLRDPKTDQAIAFANISRDISERKSMEREMIKGQKLESIGILAGGIAHDFNNLLTAITGYVSLAQAQVSPEGEVGRYLVAAGKAAFRGRDLTQQLLTFSGGGTPVRKTVAVSELIRDSVGLALTGSNVRCDIVLAPDLWHVDVDEGQIIQVMNNLLINACQAMPDGGVIQVSSRDVTLGINDRPPLVEGRYVRVSVKDHGIGIPGEHLPKIFDPYFTTKQKGNGLGLATSYAIVRKHEGSIFVESKLGVGSTFHIYLPASRNKNARQIGSDVKTLQGEGRILIMDDVEAIREVATSMLQSLGYTTADASDGVEVLELYREAMETGKPFDAVILDLTVPGGMGGLETVKNLLRMDPTAKVIVSSGYSNDGIMADYKVHGFSDVVPKPYNLKQFGDAVGRLLSKLSC
jgi:PAS domain S-box-containing protein